MVGNDDKDPKGEGQGMGEGAPDLRAGHRRASGLDDPAHAPADPKTYRSVQALFDDERADLLKHIPPWTVKKAWFALAHLLLEPGARVVDVIRKI